MRIGIVGCGTAGPAAAIFLQRAGHRVTILERAPALRPVGAGILLQPTGLRVLERLGLADRVCTLAAPIHTLDGRTTRGRTVIATTYRDLGPGVTGYGVHRGALLGSLMSAVEREGIDVRLGANAAAYRDDGRHVTVADTADRLHGPFDLLLVCDGARSALRRQTGLTRRERVYPWGALWFVAAGPLPGFGGVLRQSYRGTREMIGFLPSGRASEGEPPTVSMFCSLCHREHEALRARGIDAWKDAALDLAPYAASLLDQVTSFDQLIVAQYHDIVLRSAFTGRVALLGDAWHAMSPQLGQGANLALLDAAALADELREDRPLGASLAAYERRRCGNVRFYQFASRWLTPLFQSRASWLAPVRDALMGPAGRVGLIRWAMLDSLVGVKTGMLRRATVDLLAGSVSPDHHCCDQPVSGAESSLQQGGITSV